MDNSSEKDVLLGKRLDDQSGTGATNSVMGAMGLSTSSTHTNLTSGSGGLTATGAGSRLGLFGLGDRAVRVLGQSSLESAIILPHVATKAEVKVFIHSAYLVYFFRTYYSQ